MRQGRLNPPGMICPFIDVQVSPVFEIYRSKCDFTDGKLMEANSYFVEMNIIFISHVKTGLNPETSLLIAGF